MNKFIIFVLMTLKLAWLLLDGIKKSVFCKRMLYKNGIRRSRFP